MKAVLRPRLPLPSIALCAAAALAVLSAPAWAIINLRFTPADLVRTSSQIVLLRAAAPKDGAVAAEVVETLRGTPLTDKSLKLEISKDAEITPDEVAAALAGAKTAAALLVLNKPDEAAGADAPAGAVQIGINWFAVRHKGGKWQLDKDGMDLFAVWAGSAEMLARAARYVQADPAATFPVRSDLSWGSDLDLGKVAGKPAGCIAADFGPPTGTCAVILSDGGDRVIRAASGAEKPADVTGKLKLTTASLLAAVGDFDGDGRIDLASWNGKVLTLARQRADGVFAAAALGVKLPDCFSLAAIEAGATGCGLVAGTSAGPVLLAPDGKGGFEARPLPGTDTADLGTGAACFVGDLDGDGHSDVLRLLSKGTVLYAGEAPGKFKAPVKTAMPLVAEPRGVACGDYDTDGRLDVIVGGADGLALLSGGKARPVFDVTGITGELAYHGNANRPRVVGGSPSDVNNDGRQGVSLFYTDRKPMTFFNRGFACFGWARELALGGDAATAEAGMGDPFAPQPEQKKLKAEETLQRGQQAGAVLDLNGDAMDDMIAVDLQGEAWVLFGRRDEGKARAVVVALPPGAAGPLTVSAVDKGRVGGMYVVRPGVPASIGRTGPGVLTLQWPGPDGKPKTRRVVAAKDITRVELTP